jgi:hypothetical protein
VQWLLVSARAPRPLRDQQVVNAPPGGVVIQERQQPVRWQQADPVLSAVCRVGVATEGRGPARVVLHRIRTALRGLNAPCARITHRWLPTLVVAARLTYRALPILSWPITATSREIAGLLGLATGPLMLPGVPLGVTPALPPSPIMPTTGHGLVIGRANYPGLDHLLCLARVSNDLEVPLWFPQVRQFSIFSWCITHVSVWGCTGRG